MCANVWQNKARKINITAREKTEIKNILGINMEIKNIPYIF